MKYELLAIFFVIVGGKACTVAVNRDISEPQPLILRTGTALTGNDAYYLPSSGDVISFSEGAVVNVACPGGSVLVSGTNINQQQSEATCRSEMFTIDGKTVPFSSITCSRNPFHTARFSGASCLTNLKEVEIGFELGSRFVKHITACFDPVAQNTVYSKFDLTAAIGGYQVGYPRPSWIQDSFYSLGSNSLDGLYSRNTQRTTINALLGLSSSNTTYVHATNDYFLSRGHLAAKADFVFGSAHRLTFHLINAAPQWQTFNGGNWNTLEGNVRDFAVACQLNLEVYTGTHGVTTLPHVNTGAQVPLHLYVNGSNRGVPVPQYYWKIAYNPADRRGIAFVGVNNPYREAYTSQDTICTNICNQISYVTWKQNDVKSGYSYCCAVDDLRKVVPTIPSFTVSGVLTSECTNRASKAQGGVLLLIVCLIYFQSN